MRGAGLLAATAATAFTLAACGDGPDAGTDDAAARLARHAAPSVTDTQERVEQLRGRVSTDHALRVIGQHLGTSVVVPPNLPSGMRPLQRPYVEREGEAQLHLGNGGHNLVIQYGRATFDGCGPTSPSLVTVAGRPGVMQIHRRGEHPYATVVWPATLRNRVGRYGLSGDFRGGELLRFAAAMTRRAPGSAARDRGC